MDDIVEVHLVIHQMNEDLSVDFPFNKQTDDLDVIVGDLVDTLGMAESEKPRFRELIENQIFGANSGSGQPGAFEPIGGDYQSDDGDITDPEYRLLLEEQRQQMEALLGQQFEERRELAARLRASPGSFPPPPSSPPAQAAQPVIDPLVRAPTPPPATPVLNPIDDLIMF
jgi:hypothetical protein